MTSSSETPEASKHGDRRGSISKQNVVTAVFLALLYVVAKVCLFGEFRLSFATVLLLLALYLADSRTREVSLLVLPFWLMGEIYGAQALFVEDLRGEIHVADLYEAEIRCFGIETEMGTVTPAGWWQDRTHPLLDLVAGLGYIGFIPVFLFSAFYYRFVMPLRGGRRSLWRSRALVMMWTLFLLNVAGYVTYLIFPAAPPWYVDAYGLGPAQLDAEPQAAGAARFDDLVGIPVFASYYSKSTNVFGAIPSLHCAQTFLGFLFAISFRRLVILNGGLFFAVLFGSIYLNHHYVIDSLLGLAFGLAAGLLAFSFLRRLLKKHGMKNCEPISVLARRDERG